jgi:hypothetical protein
VRIGNRYRAALRKRSVFDRAFGTGWHGGNLLKRQSIRAGDNRAIPFQARSGKPRSQESLAAAGVIFIEENGEGPGLRLRKAAADAD